MARGLNKVSIMGNLGRDPEMRYTPNGMFATVGRDNSARLWRADGNQLAKFDGFSDVPSRVTFSHDGQRVIVGDYAGKVRVWNVADKSLVGELQTEAK